MSKETYTPWDSAEFLNDDKTIVEYLKAALEEHDPVFFAQALGNVARAMRITGVPQPIAQRLRRWRWPPDTRVRKQVLRNRDNGYVRHTE